MMHRTLARLTVVFALVSGPAAAQEDAAGEPELRVQKAFEDGNALLEQGKPAEALAAYRVGIGEGLPESSNLLYNAGLAAYLARDFAAAVQLWTRTSELDPEDWTVGVKLVQAYQATGEFEARDAQRARIVELWRAGTDPRLKKQPSFCREQLEAGGKRVFVFEFFELAGERALRYKFVVLHADRDEEDFHLSLGSYETTNAIARETGELAEGERLFHLDGYWDGGASHKTYGFYEGEPTYEQARADAIAVLEGKKAPISGSDQR